jgi:hypothetical protein
MPAGDMTGPLGVGPMTGRGFGPCARGVSIRRNCQRGLGKYFGWKTYLTEEEQIKDLEAYRQALQEEIEDIEKAISSLQKNK